MNNPLMQNKSTGNLNTTLVDSASGSQSQPLQTTSIRGLTNILDAFLARGLVSNDQYNQIKFEAVNTSKSIEQILLDRNITTKTDIAKTYAEMRNVGYVDLGNVFIPIETLNLIPAVIARDNLAIAFENLKTKVKVAMKDPLDLQRIKYLESIVKNKIEAYYASEDQIVDVIQTKYGAQVGGEVDKALQEVTGTTTIKLNKDNSTVKDEELRDEGSAPIIKIVNMMLEYGIKNGASDIHVEPREGKVGVRFRIRGVLTEKLSLPKKLLPAIVTRIKILSNLKIDEHRIPQDGRFQVNDGTTNTDIRVSIMPGVFGEKVVMRLLEKSKGIMDLEKTGIRGSSYQRVKEALNKTQGIILVTGPTGSGKSQTLASCLKIVNSTDVNIITLEDPVELKIDGVNQTQVNAEVGLSFAEGLRAILRQDPDIIMVGEIRDAETATLAVQAALVGRLVLSTIHTNSAAGAFIRLVDMGIEPFLLASTVNVVAAQRLLRVLCNNCKQPYQADANVVDQLHEELDPLNGINIYTEDKKLKLHFDRETQNVTLYKAVGCIKCNHTGYTSRSGIFEVLKMSESIAGLVMQKKSISEIHDKAVEEGMITMIQDGFIKALEGITTIEEVLRVRNE